MKAAVAALLVLAACASETTAREIVAPFAASSAQPPHAVAAAKPAVGPVTPDASGRIPFTALHIAAGRGETLLLGKQGELDELDLATGSMRKVSVRGDVAAIVVRGDVAYVLSSDDSDHELVTIDLVAFTVTAASVRPGIARDSYTDHVVSARVSIGKRGVRVSYRGDCTLDVKYDKSMGCFVYETHRFGDLHVTRTMHFSFTRQWNFKLGPLPVPDDYGEIPEATDEGADAPACKAATGSMSVDGARVATHVFTLSSGCCGDLHGGLFMCEAPR